MHPARCFGVDLHSTQARPLTVSDLVRAGSHTINTWQDLHNAMSDNNVADADKTRAVCIITLVLDELQSCCCGVGMMQ